MPSPIYQINLKQQQGAVLIISLMILIILTMLGISVMDSTKLQTRMALNTAENNRALQTAEVGLAQARSELTDNNNILRTVTENPTKPGSEISEGSYPIQEVKIKQGSGSDAIVSPVSYAIRAAQCTVVTDDGIQLPIYMESIGQSREDADAAQVILAGGMAYPMPEEQSVLYDTAGCP